MNIKYLNFLLRRSQSNIRTHKISGFTLIELIVSMAIATIVVSGLMSLTVQLLSTNQKESGQTQTQNDMQLALDYISADLRESVYVYSGDCLSATGKGSKTATTVSPDFCPGIVNHIKTLPANSMPVLAFWKLDTLPKSLQVSCGTATPPAGVPCTSGRTYTLVVYLLRKNVASDNPRWYGKARLLRYELPNYDSAGNAIANYVSPEQSGVGFRKWPYQFASGTVTNLQTTKPNNDEPDVLVDFVDDIARKSGGDDTSCPADDDTQNIYYSLTPASTTTPFTGVRSFYACVKVDKTIEKDSSGTSITVYDGKSLNQDVLIFLRGNPEGRVASASNTRNLPTLSAQVLRRSIVNKEPKAIE